MKKATTKKCAEKKCAAKKVAVKKPAAKLVKFTYRTDAGKQVFLAGSFNDWSVSKTAMKDKKGDGVFTASVRLVPGTYEYKFVTFAGEGAEAVWVADPECADFVQNSAGTLNSVITVQ